MINHTMKVSLMCASIALGGVAKADNMPVGFDPFIWTELQKINQADLSTILAFETIGDGTGSLPILPVAKLGPDGEAARQMIYSRQSGCILVGYCGKLKLKLI